MSDPILIPGAEEELERKKRRQRKGRCFKCAHKMSPSMFEAYVCSGCAKHFCSLHIDYIHGHDCPFKEKLVQELRQNLQSQLGSPCHAPKINKI